MPNDSYEPKVLVSTQNLPEADWLEYRRHGIGGSDAAAIFGVSPFKTARDLYYDKLKIASFEDDNANWVQKEVGHLLEDLVAKIFQEKTGYRVYQIKKMFYHPLHSFMLADVDYFIELPSGKTAILEIKTTNYNARDNWWMDGVECVPVYYELQGRHYMCVMNLDEVYFCCLYGNNENEVIIRHITRDTEYEDELIALEGDFWQNHVGRHIPPPYVEDGDLIIESARRHFGPADQGLPAVELAASHGIGIERYLELQQQKSECSAQLKQIESEMKRLQGRIIAEMGKGCTATCQRGGTSYDITYNPVRKTGVSKENLVRLEAQHPDIYREYVTVSESRRFNVKKSLETAA